MLLHIYASFKKTNSDAKKSSKGIAAFFQSLSLQIIYLFSVIFPHCYLLNNIPFLLPESYCFE